MFTVRNRVFTKLRNFKRSIKSFTELAKVDRVCILINIEVLLASQGPVYMEASYPARRVTRPGGTNKRSVYMKPSYSAFAASSSTGGGGGHKKIFML